LLVLSAAGPAPAQFADYWEDDLPPLPTARQEVGVAFLDGMVYVIGGILDDRSTTGIVERFDVEAGQWESIPSLPDDLHHVGAASAGGKVYVVGGLNSSFRGVQTLFAFDPAERSWERLADLPTARGAMGVAAIDDRIYAAGGQSLSTSFDTFAAYLVQENRWETLPDMPTARNHLAAASLNGTFYAIGGRSGTRLNQLEAYNPLDNAWTTLTPMPTARGGIAAAVVDESIFVFGGEGNSADPLGIFPHVEAYDPARDRWERREDMATPRHGIGAAAIEDRIFIPGGSPIQGFAVTNVLDAFVHGTPIPGDINLDGTVNRIDAAQLVRHLGSTEGTWETGDFNFDGVTSLSDFALLQNHLGVTASPAASQATTPEPTTLTLAALTLLTFTYRRPRRHRPSSQACHVAYDSA